MNSIQGVKIIDNRLSHWTPLLKTWIEFIQRYVVKMKYEDDDIVTNDAPYFYNERANIGILSGAAWKLGWIALEEFNIKKSRRKSGRCDLWIYSDKGDYIEAKLIWMMIKGNNLEDTICPSINELLNNAKKAAKEIPKGDCARIGVGFLCPGIHKSVNESESEATLNKLIKEVKKIECGALAWSFPAATRTLRGSGQYRHIVYPGIILFAAVAD